MNKAKVVRPRCADLLGTQLLDRAGEPDAVVHVLCPCGYSNRYLLSLWERRRVALCASCRARIAADSLDVEPAPANTTQLRAVPSAEEDF